MPNAFKNGYLDVTNSVQTIYTVPASTEAVVKSIRITNVNGTTADAITCDIVDSSSGNSRIASTISVPADSSLELIEKEIFLEAGDLVKLTGNQSSGYIEALISVLEIT
jgi:hypothetical protein